VLGQVTLNEWLRAADEKIERLAAVMAKEHLAFYCYEEFQANDTKAETCRLMDVLNRIYRFPLRESTCHADGVCSHDGRCFELAALWGIAYEGRWDEPPPEGDFNDAPGLTLLRQLDARLAVIQKCIEGRNLERAQDDLYALRGAVQVALRPVVPGSENAEARRDA
jgi:hypothetical protein